MRHYPKRSSILILRKCTLTIRPHFRKNLPYIGHELSYELCPRRSSQPTRLTSTPSFDARTPLRRKELTQSWTAWKAVGNTWGYQGHHSGPRLAIRRALPPIAGRCRLRRILAPNGTRTKNFRHSPLATSWNCTERRRQAA
jgi:hypothetical protein